MWNVLGQAAAGPPKGRRLRPVTYLNTFWFRVGGLSAANKAYS